MTRKESGRWLEDAKRLLDVYGKAVVRVTSETTGEHIGAVMAAEDDLRLHLTSLQSAAEGLEEALGEMVEVFKANAWCGEADKDRAWERGCAALAAWRNIAEFKEK